MNNDKILLNTYTLRSKDFPLVEFSLYNTKRTGLGLTVNKYEIEINKIFAENKALFPKFFSQEINKDNLLVWIKKRKAPKNRRFVDKILASIEDDDNPVKYVDVSHALSLNDAYWITNNLTDDKWQDFNLYHHPFDEILSYVAFTGYSHKISGVITSPEVTSNGAQKKCWSNRMNGIYLLKGDDFLVREDGRSQVMSEYYAAQVAKALDFAHIDYDLEEFEHKHSHEKELVCTCRLFTDENIGFADAYTYFKVQGIDIDKLDSADIAVQDKLSKAYGEKEYADLMLFDSIIANQDRHYGNFGYLVDNNTGEFLRPAPIFDNGLSLLCMGAQQDIINFKEYAKEISCKYLPLDTQAKWFVQKRHLPKLKKLLHFKFQKHPKHNIKDETLVYLSRFIQWRAKKAIELYYEKV